MTNQLQNTQIADPHQTFWQLTAIQLAGWTSLPTLATSILILQSNSFLGSALTILVGNAILWFIRLGIITMSYKKRYSTLDLAKEYLGKFGSYCVALSLLVSTFAWFMTQTTSASSNLTKIFNIHENPDIDQFAQFSILLGLTSTLLCLQGISLLRRLSVISLPILVLLILILFYFLPSFPYNNGNQLSLSGLSLILSTNLGLSADLPTFFRHSKSWNDSLKALTITQIATIFLAILGLYLGSIITGLLEVNNLLINHETKLILKISLSAFIFISAICSNVANVYSASVGWEIIAPKALIGRQEYLIMGLSLTAIFILFSNSLSPLFLLTASDYALVNLSLIFILVYIINRDKHLSLKQKTIYFFGWFLASSLNVVQSLEIFLTSISEVALSLVTILLAVLAANMQKIRRS
jgi:purine-cytosine permease-like protein